MSRIARSQQESILIIISVMSVFIANVMGKLSKQKLNMNQQTIVFQLN
jgi:hypothetical protein